MINIINILLEIKIFFMRTTVLCNVQKNLGNSYNLCNNLNTKFTPLVSFYKISITTGFLSIKIRFI